MRLYKETDFQITKDGKIPKEWENTKVEEVAIDLIGGGTPSTAFKEYWSGNIAWMTSAHINGMNVNKGQKYITKQGLENSATHVVPKDNLLVATRVGIGKVAVNQIDVAISQDLTGVIVDKNKTDPAFLYWAVLSNRQKLKALAQGSTIKGILRDDLGKLRLPMPANLKEQKEIAGVLGVVDAAIELADQVIAKTERLKEGLMQQLLTHGIGRTEYKETPIGKIPKHWTVTKIEDIAKLQSGGTPRRDVKEYWTDGKIPWLKSGELNDGEISYSEEKINEIGLKNSATKMFLKGTLLMAMYGKGTVTKTGVLGIDATTNQAVCAFIFKREDINPKYIQYYLIFKRNQLLNQLTNPSTDMGRTNIYAGMLGTFQVPMPKMEEQNSIVTILQNVDRKLCLEKLEKSKLQRIKHGLMDLLLTGKVRIKVD